MNSTIHELAHAPAEIALSARIFAVARLVRPANLVTSGADVLAGFVVAGMPTGQLPWRLAASICLYAGGIVLNDFFDRTLDATERTERPIPSGLISAAAAGTLGFTLLLAGIAAAFLAGPPTGLIALALAACILAYDTGLKHRAIGPVVMGSCRALNLLLGLAAAPALLPHLWPMALLPLAYIAGVTILSRGEVLGGTQNTSAISLILFLAVVLATAAMQSRQPANLLAAAPFLLLLILKAGIPLWHAFRQPHAAQIRAAVHAGIVSLIVLDAAFAAGRAGVLYGAAILSLSVVAGELGKLFPVT